MKVLLIIIAGVVSLAVWSAGYTHPTQSAASTDVKYGGVSLRFDKVLTNEVKAETIPASLEGKPSDLWPEHVAFSLVGYPRLRVLPDDSPQLRVFSVRRFRDAVESGYREFTRRGLGCGKLD